MIAFAAIDLTFIEPIFSVRFVLFVVVLLVVLMIATSGSRHK